MHATENGVLSSGSPTTPAPLKVEKMVSHVLDSLEPAYSIDPQRLRFEEPLLYHASQGTFGDVRRATLAAQGMTSDTSLRVAVKILRIADDTNVGDLKRRFAREVLVLSKTDHHNIVRFLGHHFSLEPMSAWIVFPWMPHGNARQYVVKNKPQVMKRLQLILDAANALSYLHTHKPPIRHGDVKAANLLISDQHTGKLCDFGLAFLLEDPVFRAFRSELTGTVRWCSPEALHQEAGLEADVWAWGWTVYEIFTGKIPYEGLRGEAQIVYSIVTAKGPPELDLALIPFPPVADLVRRCWERNPEKRVQIETCVQELQAQFNSPNGDIPVESKPGITEEACRQAPPPSATSVRDDSLPSRTATQNDSDPVRLFDLSQWLWCCGVKRPRGPRHHSSTTGRNTRPSNAGMHEFEDLGSRIVSHHQSVDLGPQVRATRGQLTQNEDPTNSTIIQVAIKPLAVDLEQHGGARALLAQYVRECQESQHPRLHRPIGIGVMTGIPHLVSPWCHNGNLRQLLRQDPSDERRKQIVFQLAQGLEHLHARNQNHAGLKQENVLIDSYGDPVLAEVGLPVFLDENRLGTYGDPDDVRRTAPEVLAGGKFSSASDVYSFGCLILEIMTGKRPFEIHTRPGDVVLAIEGGEPPSKLLQRCWSPLVEDRPGITKILEVIYSSTGVRPDDGDPDDPLWRAVRPPANETPAQTVLRKQQELEATRISKYIDESILKESVQIKKNPIVKILLLGQSESGKSTLLKQFQILHSTDAFEKERLAWKTVIQLNLVKSIGRILEAVVDPTVPSKHALQFSEDKWDLSPDTLQPAIRLDPVSPGTEGPSRDHLMLKIRLTPLRHVEELLNQKLASPDSLHYKQVAVGGSDPLRGLSWSMQLSTSKELFVRTNSLWKTGGVSEQHATVRDDASHLIYGVREDMIKLWHDQAVRDILRTKKINLTETSGFFLDDMERITAKDYVPTNDDILNARLKTIGVVEHRLPFIVGQGNKKTVDWRIYDVGGARSQRATWAPFFDNVQAIIFLAPVSAFDQVLAEDPKVNRLEDSMLLWRELCRSSILKKIPLILFLNKCDLLKNKLESGVQLSRYLVSYGDRSNDYNSVFEFLKSKFMNIKRQYSDADREVYVHATTVTNTYQTRTIIASGKHPG